MILEFRVLPQIDISTEYAFNYNIYCRSLLLIHVIHYDTCSTLHVEPYTFSYSILQQLSPLFLLIAIQATEAIVNQRYVLYQVK